MDIAYKSETRSLGTDINEYMKWDPHVRSPSFKLSNAGYWKYI
jgi:hypothetical protein